MNSKRKKIETLVNGIIDSMRSGKMDPRIVSFTDYKSKYVVLAPKVSVNVELTDGKVFKVDVTDYFFKEKGVVE